jgi:hypothetical protein
MNGSFKSRKSALALIAAIAGFCAASPAFAQSYSFPTHAYLHSGAGLGSPAYSPAQKAGLYDVTTPASTPWAVDPNAGGSSAARGVSR